MTVTVGMFDGSLAHIGPRLNALGLDIEIMPFDTDGLFTVNGEKTPSSAVELDYLWLSSHLNAGGVIKTAFEMALECKSIGVMQTFNAGLDNPFYKKASQKGIRICNSSAQGVAIAEYVMAQVLGIVHPLEVQREQQAEKLWTRTPFRELSRMHWLIVGYGPIGQEVAKRAKAFGAEITVVRRSPELSEYVDRAGTMADIGDYLPDADVILLACALTDETRGTIDASFFSKVKENAILVNIARGALIDDAAMIDALDNGNLATAVLDVFHQEPLPADDPLWAHPKVRMTPHTSFAGNGVQGRWDQLFLDNITRFVNGEALQYEVNPKDI